ncbi:MAG: ABC transporter substrate-binding protein [Azospirillaceae bacterium]|nr:ABC transporter substrate-binding protein [Azospirillaceae bacterium]
MKRIIKASILAALFASASSTAMAVERGGILHYGRYADSIFLDPVFADSNVDIWILTNLYDTLLLPTDDGKGVRPGLASAWQLSPDSKTVTLTLRDGLFFSDGSPITAEDVKWSLDRARKPGNGLWGPDVESIDTITIADPKTIVLALKHPDPAILASLTVYNTAVVPEKILEALPGANDEEKAKVFSRHPVVSGPFMLDSWSRGTVMKLVANPHYWQKGSDGKPLPYLDGIDFEIIPDDATRILKLQAGELDGAELIPFPRVAELQADPKLDLKLFPSTRTSYITVSVRPQLSVGSPNPLSNDKVRQALNFAVDKDALVQIVTHGIGTPTSSFLSSATALHVGKGAVFPFDLAKAKTLLTEAGYPNGFATSIFVLAGSQDENTIAAALQQMWAAIGVKLDIQQVDNATRVAHYNKGDFSMRVGFWTDDTPDPSEAASYMAYYPHIQSLHTGWKNDEVDRLFTQSQSEIDPVARAAEYAQIQKIYNATAPLIFLYETPYAVALRKPVKGFNQIPLGINIFVGVSLEK